ncbi:hypothetical protein KSP39_PZI019164 [Platanthera zijinensis]|uniref:Uncharacterized protein n=1 Tax=Platanthera zijinensis TaxID=2320716 RepID=A0AAP0FY88_9ASPA
MAIVLAGLTWFMSPLKMFKLYVVPDSLFVMWLDIVTYLHHHGHEEKTSLAVIIVECRLISFLHELVVSEILEGSLAWIVLGLGN